MLDFLTLQGCGENLSLSNDSAVYILYFQVTESVVGRLIGVPESEPSKGIYYYVHVTRCTVCTCIYYLKYQGPVVQSIVSLTSLLRVISLTVLADSIYNILIFFAKKM